MKFISECSFWTPDYIVESAWLEHSAFAFWLMETLRPRVVVELGAHNGFSYCCFCQAIENLGLNARAYAIDTWKGDEHAGFYGEDVFKTLNAYHERYRSFSQLIRSTFDDALEHFEEGSVDLLHIDGRHCYDDVKHELESWQRKLSSRGVILLHDTNVRERGFGVYKLWSEIRTDYPSFEFLHGYGLGILGVGGSLPEGLREFFAASQETVPVNAIRCAYAKLGHHASLLLANKTHESVVPKQEAIGLNQEQGQHELKEEVQQLRSELSDAHALLSSVTEDLRRVRERPMANLHRYMRWRSSKGIQKFAPILNDAFVKRMERRERKNSPSFFSCGRGAPATEVADLPNEKQLPNSSSAIVLDFLSKQDWLFSERRIRKLRKSLRKRQSLLTKRPTAESISLREGGSNSGDCMLFKPLFRAATDRGDEYVPFAPKAEKLTSRIKAIAFYLPQFHPIPENDEWWGKGFTEWTNVSKAVPQFFGHYQPRLPDALGFYDLRLPVIQEEQVELAKNYGIYGFCFYYYWFSGRKKLLDLPLKNFVDNARIDFPFCICWANENWTRRWDGKDLDILIEQHYSANDDLEFIEDLVPYLRDSRYIRVDGRPVIIVYHVDLLPNPRGTAETWRRYCEELGIGDPYLVAAQSFDIADPRLYGFDAAVEFPPHGCEAWMAPIPCDELGLINPDFSGAVHDYADTAKLRETEARLPDYTLFKTVMPSWDNQARRPGGGSTFFGSSPYLYRWWLRHVCDIADHNRHRSQKLVFINAWNEWAEGAYLEPDRRFGYAYLSATEAVISQFPATVSNQSQSPGKSAQIAVICHLYHEDRWADILPYLKNIPSEFDLYVTLSPDAKKATANFISSHFSNAYILKMPNRGRDIGPFLEVLRSVSGKGYSSVCKIHSKKSPHRGDGDKWFFDLMEGLLGSASIVHHLTQRFMNDQSLGAVGTENHLLSFNAYTSGMERYETIFLKRYGLNFRKMNARFFAGSMFWFRPKALIDLAEDFYQEDFEREQGQLDGTLAHFIERVFPTFCESKGFKVLTTEEVIARKVGAIARTEYEFAESHSS